MVGAKLMPAAQCQLLLLMHWQCQLLLQAVDRNVSSLSAMKAYRKNMKNSKESNVQNAKNTEKNH